MDVRFEAVDKRFETMQKQIDQWFEDANRRFESIDMRFNRQTALISIGFIAITTLITVFQFLG